MCLPLLPALALGAAAISATGAVMGGIAAKKGADYKASIADQNAAIDQRAAQDAIERGRTAEYRSSMATGRAIGEQRAAMGANGIEVDYGSGAAVQEDTRTIGGQDQATLHQNAQRESQGYEINAWNQRAGASAARADGKAALVGSLFKAGSTLLSSASQFGGFGGGGSASSLGYSPPSGWKPLSMSGPFG